MRVIPILIVLLLCSCGASMRVSLFGAKDIAILKEKPSSPYKELSLVAGVDTELPTAFDELRLSAQKLGADAVILDTSLSIFKEYKKKLVGMSIRYDRGQQ